MQLKGYRLALVHYLGRVGASLDQGGVKLLAKRAFRFLTRKFGYQRDLASARAQTVELVEISFDASLAVDGITYIPQFTRHEISIVIPTYGEVQHTLACVASIVTHPPTAAYEVIVINDAYLGEDAKQLNSQISGAVVVHNQENIGFVRSCNYGASIAKGKYILFLNNDTKILPDSIDALHRLLVQNPDVGLAGSKLVYPDGTLQEAGGIIWSDGNCCNYGRGDFPFKPEYCYLRDVDYISGAAIMIEKYFFDALGGFDLKYAPAYCEDADLALKVRAIGRRVVMEPRSIIVHFEGISNGTNTSTGVKSYQVINTHTMRDAWADLLAEEHYPSTDYLALARDQRKGAPRILVIDGCVPEPDRDAGSRTIRHILGALVRAGWVVKFWPTDRKYSKIYTPPLQDIGIEVVDCRSSHSLATWLEEYGYSLNHVIVSRPTVASDVLKTILRRVKVPVSYYGHDLHFLRMQRQALEQKDNSLALEAEIMKSIEQNIWRRVRAVMYPSEMEVRTVKDIVPGKIVRAIPLYCFNDFLLRSSPPIDTTLLFVAGFAHSPNVDAALFLINSIAPLVWARYPNVNIILAGSRPTQEVLALAGDKVMVTGWISDEHLAKLYATARVAVVPLTYGAGVKGKVVEALAMGLPLVTTSIGAEGILGIEKAACIADDPMGFAAGIIKLLEDDHLWLAQSASGIEYAKVHYSPLALQHALINTLESAEKLL